MAKGLILLAKDTFTTASTVSFNNVFSATYKQYKLVINVSSPSNGALVMRLRASGSDNTAANYRRQYVQGNGASIAAGYSSTNTLWFLVGGNAVEEIIFAEVLYPFQTTNTSMFCNYNGASSGNIQIVCQEQDISVTTSYDGFTIFADTGTITGSVTIYGIEQ
jgi:hypothetical protein